MVDIQWRCLRNHSGGTRRQVGRSSTVREWPPPLGSGGFSDLVEIAAVSCARVWWGGLEGSCRLQRVVEELAEDMAKSQVGD